MQMSNKKFIPVLSGKVIENKKDQEVVLVNTNRLYEKLALETRSIADDKEREKVVEVQKKALAKMKTEREMFVPMTVKEVKISFGSSIDKLPYNTFRIEIKANDDLNNSIKVNRLSKMNYMQVQQGRMKSEG